MTWEAFPALSKAILQLQHKAESYTDRITEGEEPIMEGQLSTRLTLFAENVQGISKRFFWKNALSKRLAALLYTAQDRTIDCDAIQSCYELIKQRSSFLSFFSGNSSVCLATLLSLADNQEARLTDTMAVYGQMKANRFASSDYLVMAAHQIAAGAAPSQHEQAIEKAAAFFSGMKKEHRFLTGRDDYIFAAMFGISDLEPAAAIAHMEELYDALNREFLSNNSVQTLTQVLVLGHETAETITRLQALREAFRAQGIRLDKEYTLPSLGILALLPVDTQTIVEQVQAAYEFLRTQKGLGSWSVTKQELLLYAAALVALSSVANAQDGIVTASLSTSIINIIIAMQTAMVIVAASAAASSSSSN